MIQQTINEQIRPKLKADGGDIELIDVEGDKVIVTNVGAYTLTFSNRFPYSLPNIFLVKDNDIKQIFTPSIDHDFSIY